MSGSFLPLPQIQPFQAPDLIGMSNALQTQSLNAMREQQLMGAERENMSLRQLMADPSFDPTAPGAMNRILAVAPRSGAQTYQALMAGQRERRQADVANTENAIKLTEYYVNRLPGANAETWPALRDEIRRNVPGWASQLPENYDPARISQLTLNAERSLSEWERVEIQGMPFRVNRRLGLIAPFTEAPPNMPGAAPAPPPAASGGVATPMSAPAPAAAGGMVTPLSAPTPAAAAASDAVPLSQRTDTAAVLPAIDRAEGRGANPASSARGQFQFIDPTFVDEFKRNFPDIARGLSDRQILGYRNSTLPDGRSVEEVLGEAHTNRNARELEKSGFEPNGANLYLAHFAGLGGARRLLRADPNAPVESVLDKDAVDANPFLKGKTVGQIRQWAADTLDYSPGQARRRLLAMGAADNTPAPGAALTSPVLQTPLAEGGAAPVTNAMTATPVSNAFVKPTIGDGMKAGEAILASRPLATPVSDVRPAGPGLPRNIAEAFEFARQREEEQARARARGTEAAKSEKEKEDNVRNIDSALDIINNVTKLDPNSGLSTLGRATGSRVGALRDWVYSWGGWETDESKAAARLETAHARIASLLPRMRGDLNKAEVEMLQAQAAKLGDRTRPNKERAEALVELTADLERVRERLTGQRVGPPTSTQPRSAPAAPAEGGWSIRPVQ